VKEVSNRKNMERMTLKNIPHLGNTGNVLKKREPF